VPLWLNIFIMTDPAAEVLALTQRLLDAIAAGDWPTYEELCAPDLTAFEPEACGHLVEGLAFHRFYFDLPARPARRQTTLAAPRVRLLGDVAVVTYVRLNQQADPDGVPHAAAFAETRVWQRHDGRWRHVHFHRSVVSG
jgi:calcium/calmodulin-dependent protein kinase (CaM kinase) II